MIALNIPNSNGVTTNLFRHNFQCLAPHSSMEQTLYSMCGQETILKNITLSGRSQVKLDIYMQQHGGFMYEPILTLYTSEHNLTLVFDTDIPFIEGQGIKFQLTNVGHYHTDMSLMVRYTSENLLDKYERGFTKSLESNLASE